MLHVDAFDLSDALGKPEGLRLRIKPSINLHALGLHPQALAIAQAMQTYGVYLGDSGGSTALKLEDTRTEGRGQLWTDLVDLREQVVGGVAREHVGEPGLDTDADERELAGLLPVLRLRELLVAELHARLLEGSLGMGVRERHRHVEIGDAGLT